MAEIETGRASISSWRVAIRQINEICSTQGLVISLTSALHITDLSSAFNEKGV